MMILLDTHVWDTVWDTARLDPPGALCECALMRTTLEIPDAVFKKTKLKAVHEGVPLKVVVTRALEREVGGDSDGEANDAAIEEALAPQLRFLAMTREEQKKALLEETRWLAGFYRQHPEEVIPDVFDHAS